MLAAVLASIPYGAAEAFKVVDIGAGEGRLGRGAAREFSAGHTSCARRIGVDARARGAQAGSASAARAKVRPFKPADARLVGLDARRAT
jgi:hypothetical protein